MLVLFALLVWVERMLEVDNAIARRDEEGL